MTLYAFTKLLFIRILYENTSTSRPQGHNMRRHALVVRHSYAIFSIAFVPYLHCGSISTFWPKQLLVFCPRTDVSRQPLVVIINPDRCK
ncbi:hypothetical protein ACTXT7_000176 [Hymenolepis weldensis]